MNVVTIRSLVYAWPGVARPTLDLAALDLAPGQSLFLRGPSGCGKSTLLSAIAGVIEVPRETVFVAGTDVGRLDGAARDRFRADHIGIIFQVFNLLPWLSARDNVLLPLRFSPRRRKNAGAARAASDADRLLDELGLGDKALSGAPAGALSVGQQQRVAAARALIGGPELILADEPTSALDEDAKQAFVDLLLQECRAARASLLFVSHDRTLERHFDRALDFAALNRSGQGAA